MSRKFLSVLLALTMILSVFLAACNDDPKESSNVPTAESTPEESTPEASTPAESPTDTPTETDPPSLPVSDVDPTKDGTLWYYEDFDSRNTTLNTKGTAAELGWTVDLIGNDPEIQNNSAAFKIVKNTEGKHLSVRNYATGMSGSDSFVIILRDDQFRYLHKYNYTYQYDLIYDDASSDSRYISLVSELDRDFYNVFYFRNGGYAHNQYFDGISHTSYDSKCYDRGSTSIANKLLGKSSSGQVFKGISVSIRYAVNWSTGSKVYVRINDEGYPGSGKWTLVSSLNVSDSKQALDKEGGGAGLGIKVGGKQNGFIDNIIVWAGNGNEPEDKSNPYLSTADTCHKLAKIGNTSRCYLCGKTEATINDPWLLKDIPAYDGGRVSDSIYFAGQGIDPLQTRSDEAKMLVVSETNKAEFETYLKKIEADGYKLEFTRDSYNNLFRSYINEKMRIYTYFIEKTGEVRVIYEKLSMSESLDKIGYSYEPKAGERTEVYQYAIPNRNAEHTAEMGYSVHGMLYIFKLADDSVIMVDGGENIHWPDERLDALMDFLRDITHTPEGQKVRIAAWYNTHTHSDHVSGFGLFIKKFHESLTLERVVFNAPSYHGPSEMLTGRGGNIRKMSKYIDEYFDNVQHIKLHTGMVLNIADVQIEVMYTHDDLVHSHTGISEVDVNFNESCTVSKFHFNGKSLLMLGDIDVKGDRIILENWPAEALRSDIVQIAHHTINNVVNLYKAAKAPVIFVPTSRYYLESKPTYQGYVNIAKQFLKNNMIYFQGDGVTGIAVENGELKKIYEAPLVYGYRTESGW